MNSDDVLRQSLSMIASQFQRFECQPCSDALRSFLQQQGKTGKVIKLYTGTEQGKYGNIYHEQLRCNISTNGHHQGVVILLKGLELVFDNIHPQGIPKTEWLNNFYCIAIDLGDGFEITEETF